MTRSRWKSLLFENKNITETHVPRSLKILPAFLNKTFEVHNGIAYIKTTVNENMIDCKFGEFAITRKKHVFKKKKKRK
jgi:small subunit ribosomal protein S19